MTGRALIFALTFSFSALALGYSAQAQEEGALNRMESIILRKQAEYFNYREDHKYKASYGMLSDSLRKSMSFRLFSAFWASFQKENGRMTHLKNEKITTYNSNTRDGKIYFAVDFRAAFESKREICGYLIWEFGSELKITREDFSILPMDADKMKPPVENRLPLQLQPSCM